MKLYCPHCGDERDIIVIQKQEIYPVKGENTTIIANICTCAVCGEEVYSLEHDDDNLCRAFIRYRQKHNLLTPEEIKDIRTGYGVSQVAFARILGVGDKTIARYENGCIQDEAINNLIMLAKIPENFMRLVEKNKAKLSDSDLSNIKDKYGNARMITVWCTDKDNNDYIVSAMDQEYIVA